MFFFFFNDTATTEIYTLSLHDALPISLAARLTHERTPASAVPRTRQPVERPACEPLDPRLERARRRSATPARGALGLGPLVCASHRRDGHGDAAHHP